MNKILFLAGSGEKTKSNKWFRLFDHISSGGIPWSALVHFFQSFKNTF